MPRHPVIQPTFTRSGALAALLADDLSLLQFPASELEAGPHQVWLRKRGAEGTVAFPLTGPGTGAQVAFPAGGAVLTGAAAELEWTLWWDQPAPGLFGWSIAVRNTGGSAASFDAVYTLDAALTPPAALARNEAYVSQYLDVTPLGSGERFALAVRQNMPGSGNPWLAVTATTPVAGWCTDARQVRSAILGTGLDLTGELPSERLQHEHTLVGLQTAARELAPGEAATVGFRVALQLEHPAKSEASDLERALALIGQAAWAAEPPAGLDFQPVPESLFSRPDWVHGAELDEDTLLELAGEAVGAERGPQEELWSYWSGGRHVVTGAKELAVLRPHGHILRATAGYTPQDVNAASTAWMAGTFASQLTRGHAHADPVISVRRSHLGLTLAEGLRIFVRAGGRWQLLGVPSAWAVTDETAVWWYRWNGRLLSVRTELTLAELTLSVEVVGPEVDLLIAARGQRGDAAPLFGDGGALDIDMAAFEHLATTVVTRAFPLGEAAQTPPSLTLPQLATDDPAGQRLARMIPAFGHNALIHYQVPRGLEQFTGGAWGSRDVCQGPVGLLTAADRPDLVREVLLTVFAGQQDDGDWPQWFDYLATHAAPGHRDSHGDIVYWPLLALGEYLEATGDATILAEPVRWVGEAEFKTPSTVLAHVEAAVGHLMAERSADSRLPSYGHGDWNDALQPANPTLAAELVSTWTATLEIKALRTLASGLRAAHPGFANELDQTAAATEEALRELLLIDGELCGYAVVTPSGVDPLVHPRDQRAGLNHGSLQMIHALADELLGPEEAATHLRIIDAALDGPTGIYLFDRPVNYDGGETHTFLRAEAASFWGREIGLMYTHAHVRWVEALTRLGLAERAWQALQLVLPDGLRAAVSGAVPMQSNCYFSSVDALFPDRYAAQDEAQRLFDPETPFAGGWRVYSSGPGLILRLLVEHLLGLRWTQHGLEVDPVLPADLDGLTASLSLGGREVQVTYAVRGVGHGVAEIALNGRGVDTEPLPRRYRPGGVRIPRAAWDTLAGDVPVELHLTVGTAGH